MTTLNTNPSVVFAPAVSVINNQVKTTSKAIAEFFGKLHKNVLRSIENLKADCDHKFYALNFELVDFLDEKGERRPMYEITKDGFVLLVMGFTGKQALAFKVAYIQRFNEMEATLKVAPEIPTNPHLALRTTIQAIAKGDRRLYKALYSRLYHQFQVTSYKNLNDAQCLTAIDFIKTVQGEYIPRDKIEAPKPSLALCDGQHYVVAKDGAVLLHKVLSHDINDSCLKTMGIGQDKFDALKKDLAHFCAPEDPHLQITYSTAQRTLSMLSALLVHLENHGFNMALMYQKTQFVQNFLTNYYTRLEAIHFQMCSIGKVMSLEAINFASDICKHPTVVNGYGAKIA